LEQAPVIELPGVVIRIQQDGRARRVGVHWIALIGECCRRLIETPPKATATCDPKKPLVGKSKLGGGAYYSRSVNYNRATFTFQIQDDCRTGVH